jgi:ribose 5-phosphate isomerase B
MPSAKISLSIANDHAGTDLKNLIVQTFKAYHWLDHGTGSKDSVDYPDHVHPLAESVSEGKTVLGVLICGSGNGVCMTANKHQGIRAALCWTEEISALARQHNDANVICIPARFVSEELALQMVKVFLETKFEGGRHQKRVDKISC